MRYLLAFFTMLLVQCKKDNADYWGMATCKINGVAWSGLIRAAWDVNGSGTLGIIIDKYNEEGFLRQSFSLFALKPLVGNQKIYRYELSDVSIHSATARYFTATDDGDVGCDGYNVMAGDSLVNFVSFTEIRTIPRIVAGKFNLRFVIDQLPKCDPNAPDTLWITEGSFLTRY